MNDILEKDVDGPVVNEVERSSSAFSTGQAPHPQVGSLERGQRWTVRRKQEAVLRLLRGCPSSKQLGRLSLFDN